MAVHAYLESFYAQIWLYNVFKQSNNNIRTFHDQSINIRFVEEKTNVPSYMSVRSLMLLIKQIYGCIGILKTTA